MDHDLPCPVRPGTRVEVRLGGFPGHDRIRAVALARVHGDMPRDGWERWTCESVCFFDGRTRVPRGRETKHMRTVRSACRNPGLVLAQGGFRVMAEDALD